MTVPTNFNTWDRIVREALRNAGKLQDGQDPTSEQYAVYFTRVQDMVNLAAMTAVRAQKEIVY